MIRKLLPAAAAAVLALSSAQAESIFIPDDGWVPPPPPTEYEMVEEADRILVVRAAVVRGETARFRIEEEVKGEMGKARWLHASSEATEGSLYLVFLDRNEDEWVHSDLGFLEIESEDEDWVQVLRLFSGIAELDDEELEKKALRELREAALADPDRYPAALLVRMIDQHFGTPTPDKPFSDLVDLYDAAANDVERLDVLWALRYGEHPETAAFFRSLLLGGEPLWLIRPVLEWMGESEDADLPLLKDLARVWLGHPGEDRTRLLGLMLEIAEPEDAPLLWSLLPSADLTEKAEILELVLGRPDPDRFVESLRLPPDERSKADLFVLWMGDITSGKAHSRLEALLRKEQTRDWRSMGSLEELLSELEASREPAERREILMEVRRRAEDEVEELAVIWRLLRQASLREAEALLQWAAFVVEDEEVLAALYRAASGDEEKNRALWLLLAIQGRDDIGPLLSAAGAFDQGSVRLERLARAFLTCPNEEVRSEVAEHLEEEEELATAGDFLTMLKVLEGASLAEARLLAPWFTRHPGPEALSILWRLPIPSLYEDAELAQALAAAGDPEVLDLALDLRRRLATEDDDWVYDILARSPLPAAQEEARLILKEGGHARQQLLWQVAEEDNASPWREWYLQEIADSEAADEAIRQYALSYLAKLSEPEP